MPEVGVILLAAGASARLGQPKQLVTYQGKTLLRRAAEAAVYSVCRPIVVVLGAQAALMQLELDGLPVTPVENVDWASGMASSLQVGLAAMPETAAGVVVMVCDQPGLSSEILDALVAAGRTADAPLAACEYVGALGVPAFFEKSLFPELRALTGQEGAKKIILRHVAQAARVSFPEGGWDLDTPGDLAQLPDR